MKKKYEEKLADCRIHEKSSFEREWHLRAITLIKKIEHLEGKKIADFGCSGCQFLTLLSKQVSGEYWGGDFAINAVEHAKKLGFNGFNFDEVSFGFVINEIFNLF